jgi:hypothetical protein
VRRLFLLPLLLLALSLVLATPAGPARAATEWSWPLQGSPTVVRGFDPPATPWGAGHRGVDLEGAAGEAVLSAGAGVVTYAGQLAGRGVVTVTHADGLRTTYEPVEPTVTVGDAVAAGEVLGRLAEGHASCGAGRACLHWGLLRGQTYLDPLTLLSPGHVRLLPLAGDGQHDHDKHRKRTRRSRSSEERERAEKEAGKDAERGAEKAEGRLARWRHSIGRAASQIGRAAARGARAAGRLVVRAGSRLVRSGGRLLVRAGGWLVRSGGRLLVRVGVRAAPYALRVAPYALEAMPYVAIGALVVGGTVWYLRHR